MPIFSAHPLLLTILPPSLPLGIAKQELMAMLEEEELKDAILLVFANKQDSKGAMNSRQVRFMLF